jgi:hypothetical protein
MSGGRALNVDGDEAIPEMSPGAIALLAIAQENDTQGKIADNAALRIALDAIVMLRELCVRPNNAGLLTLLGENKLPSTWFGFCVILVKAIDSQIEEQSRKPSEGWSVRTDFDRNVYLAIGQSIGTIIREHRDERRALDFTTEELIESLGKSQPRRLQQLLIENYIGNILQELFDTCKVRLARPGLPKDTELRLRKDDAHALAELLFAEMSKADSAVDVASLLESLRRKLTMIRKKDAEYD